MTRYRRLARRQALPLATLLAVGVVCCLSISWGDWEPVGLGLGGAGSDVVLFDHVIQRVRSGEAYYDAMGSELRSHNYPARSVFNWRTPLHLYLCGRLPSLLWGRLLLLAGAAAAVAMAFAVMCRERHQVLAAILVLVMSGAIAPSFVPSGVYFAEVWAGVLIAVSTGAYACRWWHVGAASGVLALFYRELALPYVVVSLLLAYRGARRGEVRLLLVGVACYAVYFVLHALAVATRIRATDAVFAEGWMRFGGIRFILDTSSSGLLWLFPRWVSALYLPLALLGLGGWLNPTATRLLLTVGAYLLAFAVIGQPVNSYWGAIYAPLLAFGVVWSAPACRDLAYALGSRAKT